MLNATFSVIFKHCDHWSMVKSWLYFKEQEHEQQFKGKSQKVFRARYADGLTLVFGF